MFHYAYLCKTKCNVDFVSAARVRLCHAPYTGYKLTSLDGSLVGVGNSSGCLFCDEQVGTNGPDTGVSPVPPSISESKLKVPVDGVWMGTPCICVGALPPSTPAGMLGAVNGRCTLSVLGRALGCCLLSVLLRAFSVGLLMLQMLVGNMPKLTGVLGVFREHDTGPVGVVRDWVNVDILGSGQRFANGGPSWSSDEPESTAPSCGSCLMCCSSCSLVSTGLRSSGELLRPVELSVASKPVMVPLLLSLLLLLLLW